jgi:YggT family protein
MLQRGVNRNHASGLPFGACRLSCVARDKGVPMTSLYMILMLILDILWFLILAHVIMSWLINFQVLNIRQQLVGQVWYGLNRLLEPLYGPIRRLLPQMGGLDLAPLVVIVAVAAARIVLQNNAAAFF